MKAPLLQRQGITTVFAVLDGRAGVFQHYLRWLRLLLAIRYLKLQTLAYSLPFLPPQSIVSFVRVDAASLALNLIHLRTLSRVVHSRCLRKLALRSLLRHPCH